MFVGNSPGSIVNQNKLMIRLCNNRPSLLSSKPSTVVGVAVQYAKLPPATPVSDSEVMVYVPASLFSIQLYANVFWEAADDGLYTWGPAIHVGDTERGLGSWLWPALALLLQAFGASQPVDRVSLSVSVCVALPFNTKKKS